MFHCLTAIFIIYRYTMLSFSNKFLIFNFDNIIEKDNNKDWPYRKLIIGPSGNGKTNYLLNSIQRDNNIIDKIYLYAKDLEEPKYQLLINKRKKPGINFNNDPNAFIEYSNSMDDILSDIEDYNKKRKRKVLIVFDDMISHVMSDKKAQQILKDLLIRCRNYKDFIKIYRVCTKEPFNFLTIDTTKDNKFIKNFDEIL